MTHSAPPPLAPRALKPPRRCTLPWPMEPAHNTRPMTSLSSLATATGQRTLILRGLSAHARLGILERERAAPQPIEVDAELNLGCQPLLAPDDDIARVLDYRQVRQLIIDECGAGHINLLETLAGKLCARLLQLPGVQGARVRVAKLKIFDDCEVAIRVEAGQWP